MHKAENLKKQLAELSDVINTFSSEAVQLIIVDRIFDQLEDSGSREHIGPPIHAIKQLPEKEIPGTSKKNGATKILNHLLENGFFDTPKSIGELADFCNANYKGPFYTNQLSGLLLAMVNKGRLQRTVSTETNSYVYTKTESF